MSFRGYFWGHFAPNMLTGRLQTSDLAVLLCYSTTSGGRRYRAWPGNPILIEARLRLDFCLITKIFYWRETHLHNWEQVWKRDLNECISTVAGLNGVDLKPIQTLSLRTSGCLSLSSNWKEILVLAVDIQNTLTDHCFQLHEWSKTNRSERKWKALFT